MASNTMDLQNLIEDQIVVESNDSLLRKDKRRFLWLTLGFLVLFGCMIVAILYIRVEPGDRISTSTSTTTIATTSKPQSTSEIPTTTLPSTTIIPDRCGGDLPDLNKIDCHPDVSVNEENCKQRGCCYHPTNDQSSKSFGYKIPQCYYPLDYKGYKVSLVSSGSEGSLKAILDRVVPSGFPKDIQKLNLIVTNIDDSTVRIRITDSTSDRFEAPLIKRNETTKAKETSYKYSVDLSPDGLLSVTRVSTKIKLFSTDLSFLVYADQFLHLVNKLPSKYIYGLGENYTPFLKNITWTQVVNFNKDNFPLPDTNIYGTHPFYLSMENENGNSHGVFLLNSNGMDMTLQSTPSITYRTIGGILDFFIFLGPSPNEVIQQYTTIVGNPIMPPYWSLGFHLCKYGYYNTSGMREVYERTREAGVPYDVQWNDIDAMDRNNDFSYDKENFGDLPEFIKELHNEGMRYMIMFDPGVSNTEKPGTYPPYDEGVEDDIFIKNSTDGIFLGKVWNPINTVFPDFTHPNASEYWTRQFKYFHDVIPFDGAWIDMNEISNFHYNGTVDGCPEDSSLENPPYVPGNIDPLYTKTLCMTAKHYSNVQYNEHNLHGYREAIATNMALKNVLGKQPFIISRSTFAGQGYFSGHWSGDIASSWEDMRYSVANMLTFNLFGIPMIGSDICGFRLSTTPELCARWFALGAFYPFSRNHNDINRVDQDPAGPLGEQVLNSAKKNLLIRYSLLPHLYTLFYRSHVLGETVVRPLFFEFSNDPSTYVIDEQFLWGANFMVMPVLYEDHRAVVAYFPKGLWYDFHTGEKRESSGEKYTLHAELDHINLAIRGGSILVLQEPNTTTTLSRQNNFMLYVSLDEQNTSAGQLYWDDGDSIENYENHAYNLINFAFRENSLVSAIDHSGYSTNMTLGLVRFFGLDSPPTNVAINQLNATFEWKEEYNVLDVHTEDISLLTLLNVNLY